MVRGHRPGQSSRAVEVDVRDGEPTGARDGQRRGHGHTRAARAEQHDVPGRHGGQCPGQALGEAVPIGVVTDRAAMPEDDGVHGTEFGGLGREVVEVLDHLLLAGMGDVQTAKAQLPCVRQQLTHVTGGQAENVDVDDRVEIAETLPVGLALVQHRAHRRRDPRTDQAHQVTLAVHDGLQFFCTN
ncbi:hypothetical protein ADL15_26515 [Actinoplanes awajinensis subsp. mycoplanecinus]|uniref:Uncharacterized protein n=1 Tax=Actinoplanes awajinensis subsp. mycoplanecinus TaxID=135947 RepID=A0A101JMJ6_9ACTN|nr:hypothetical protein [Actinoplanes awajinensis]KUL29669.1 hypothetical protein ADL15_26515 [Actinoplanes awajinensis subsp. mycoplanecinus]